MRIPLDRYRFLAASLIMSVLLAVILLSILSWSLKEELQHELTAVAFVVDSDREFDGTLYYSYGSDFSSEYVLQDLNEDKDTLLFVFPEKYKVPTKFRLDLGNDNSLQRLAIKKMELRFEHKTITLDQETVYNNLFLHSASVELERADYSFKLKNKENPFDPYIVFNPMGTFALPSWTFLLALLSPFFISVILYGFKYYNPEFLTFRNVLAFLFVICIPLKIAWTTFTTILLVAYGGFGLTRSNRQLNLNSSSYLLLMLFLVIILFGRPDGFDQISKEFAYLLFAFIGATVSLPYVLVSRIFTAVFAIFNAIMLAAGITFLIWFKTFYGLEVWNYFSEIKIYSGFVREWLLYPHPAFLSFFGIIGTIFLRYQPGNFKFSSTFVWTYHLFLIGFIVLSGARISLIIYIIFCLNLFLKLSGKKLLMVNGLLLFSFISLLTINIGQVDKNREHIWRASVEAIKEKPWLGYGINGSAEVLQNPYFYTKSGVPGPLEINHSHNQYLTGVIELGTLGMVMLFLILAFFFIRYKYYGNKPLLLFVFGLGYIFMTESILLTSKPLYVICFLFIILNQIPDLGICRPKDSQLHG